MYWVFVLLIFVSWANSQTVQVIQLAQGVTGGTGVFNFDFGTAPLLLFNITNACGQGLYTVQVLSFMTPICFDVHLLDAAGNVIPATGFPTLDIQPTAPVQGTTMLVVRTPPAACPFETVQITRLTGNPNLMCQGSLTALVSSSTQQAVGSMNLNNVPINGQQYQFYQFANLIPTSAYAVMATINPLDLQPMFEFTPNGGFPTPFNCKDTITQATKAAPFIHFRVVQPNMNPATLSLGVSARTASTYNVLTYVAAKTPVNIGMTTPMNTLLPNTYQWFAIQNPAANIAVTLTVNQPLTQPLNLAWSMNAAVTPFPSIWDSNFMPLPIATPINNIANAQVVGIYNPSGNNVNYQLQFTATTFTPTAAIVPQVTTANQAQLALSLGAIIGIAVGSFAFVLIIVGLVCVYSKVKANKKAAEYQAVATSGGGAAKKEPSSTTSSSTTDSAEDEETEEEQDDEYDSYPPPRNSSRVYRSRGNNRGPNRGPNNRGPSRSRDRSYSDEDDDSSDYS